MSLRILVCLLLVFTVVALRPPLTPAAGQGQAEEAGTEPKWEYQVVTLDANRCGYEDIVSNALNSRGQKGWELVSYQQAPPQFPKEAGGEILIRPAATGPGKEVTPQVADSFQGTITMKINQAQPGACRLLLKRQFRPPAHP